MPFAFRAPLWEIFTQEVFKNVSDDAEFKMKIQNFLNNDCILSYSDLGCFIYMEVYSTDCIEKEPDDF